MYRISNIDFFDMTLGWGCVRARDHCPLVRARPDVFRYSPLRNLHSSPIFYENVITSINVNGSSVPSRQCATLAVVCVDSHVYGDG